VGRVPDGRTAGGSRQLLQLIDEHGSAILADLQRYYGLDLRDLWREGTTLTPRYVLWLVEHLPHESATVASMKGGPEHRPWTLDVYLMAHMVNLLAGANHQRAGKRMRKPPVLPPKIKPTASTAAAKKRRGRVVRIADISARRALAKQINNSSK
jgi:hypothetical protein